MFLSMGAAPASEGLPEGAHSLIQRMSHVRWVLRPIQLNIAFAMGFAPTTSSSVPL